MVEQSSPDPENATDSAFIELAIEMANLGRVNSDGDEEALRAVDSILKEAAALKRSIGE